MRQELVLIPSKFKFKNSYIACLSKFDFSLKKFREILMDMLCQTLSFKG